VISKHYPKLLLLLAALPNGLLSDAVEEKGE